MGWWEGDEGLLGDGPVDLLEDRLSEWDAEGIRPSWQEFLDALGTALQDRGPELVSDPESLAGDRLAARFEPTGAVLHNRADAPRGRHHFTMSEALEQMAEEYEETQRRKPRLSELLGTIAFSLRVKPERFLRNDERWKLARLETLPEEERA